MGSRCPLSRADQANESHANRHPYRSLAEKSRGRHGALDVPGLGASPHVIWNDGRSAARRTVALFVLET